MGLPYDAHAMHELVELETGRALSLSFKLLASSTLDRCVCFDGFAGVVSGGSLGVT
jgi:hypothetical protein